MPSRLLMIAAAVLLGSPVLADPEPNALCQCPLHSAVGSAELPPLEILMQLEIAQLSKRESEREPRQRAPGVSPADPSPPRLRFN